jgi:hypothetical protein
MKIEQLRLAETCYGMVYWDQHIQKRALLLHSLLELLQPVLIPTRSDLGATPRQAYDDGTCYTYGPEYDNVHAIKTVNAALRWLAKAPRSYDDGYLISDYGISPSRKAFEYNWIVGSNSCADQDEYEEAPPPGKDWLPRNDWHVYIAIRRGRPKKHLPFQDELIRVFIESEKWAACMPCYGFMTLRNPKQCRGILSFTHCWGLERQAPKREREIEALWWHPSFDRSTHVRGVYWGNLFGPKLVKLLHKRGDILNRYDAWRWTNADGKTEASPHRRVQYLANGSAFLSMTDNVLDDSPSSGLWAKKVAWAMQLRAWLESELRRAKILMW